jgi:Na+/H+ antiporter NhaD/arsenite permease-like protein
VGSAATLIGNPQNMLIGQTLGLSFAGYLRDAAAPSVVGLVAVWWIIRRSVAGAWVSPTIVTEVPEPAFNRWQTAKAIAVLAVLVTLFLVTSWPREVLALAAAGLLLASRRMHSRHVLGIVDWQLLVLFVGLFVVNHALMESGILANLTNALRAKGVEVAHPGWLFAVTVLLSNVVSNVPAVMLLLPSATHPQAGAILALASTLAGNLLIVGSIANIIVVDQAAQVGVRITWREHVRVGVPVTVATLLLAAAWLFLRYG